MYVKENFFYDSMVTSAILDTFLICALSFLFNHKSHIVLHINIYLFLIVGCYSWRVLIGARGDIRRAPQLCGELQCAAAFSSTLVKESWLLSEK